MEFGICPKGINGLTLFFSASSFRAPFMDEPTPDSPVPPRPPEAAKVQPKKETVRIALPPKPTAAPTIKLPALPPTGAAPTAAGAPTAARPASAPAAAATAQVPRPPSPPTAAAAKAPGTSVAKPPAPAPAKAPMPPPAARPASSARTVGSLDTALAVVAMIIGIAALVSVLLLVVGDFGSIK